VAGGVLAAAGLLALMTPEGAAGGPE